MKGRGVHDWNAAAAEVAAIGLGHVISVGPPARESAHQAKHRRAWHLHRVEGLTCTQVAAVFGTITGLRVRQMVLAHERRIARGHA